MAFYPHPHQFPIYMNAYPMPFPNQEFYPMYPPHPQPHPGSGHGGHHGHGHGHGHGAGHAGLDGVVYFESVPPQSGAPNSGSKHMSGGKYGYNNRKDSSDSGISDYSMNSSSSRKTSMASTVSGASAATEESTSSSLEDVKEEMPPYEEPDDDTCEKIVQQVEFYFSDANITKDKFLLKHVKRNKEGFVSLKLISSFKRVKHLTKDWRQVAAAIERKSERLEVNDLKTKVRRLDELPEYDETTPSRTVVALNLPLERPTIEGVAEIFTVCGEIVLIRILRPGNPIPADIKPFVNKHPEMVSMVCALVEFERTEFALKAVRELNNEEDPEKMKVMELTAPPAKTAKKDEKKKSVMKQLPPTVQPQHYHHHQQQPPPPARRFSHAGFGFPGPHHQQPGDQMGPRRKISLYHNMKFGPIAEEHKKEAAAVAVAAALNPNAPTFQMQQQQPVPRRSIPRSAYMNPAAAMEAAAAHAAAAQAAHQAAASMQMQMQMHAHAHAHAQSQWMSPRRFTGGGMDMAASGLAIPPSVMRLPRGPDKGKGFREWCRSRKETTSHAPAEKKKSHAVPIVAPPEEAKAAGEAPKIEVTPVAAAAEKKGETEKKEEDAPSAAAAAAAEDREVVDVSDDGVGDSGNDSEPDADSGAAAAAAAAPVIPAASADRIGLAAAVESVAERAAEKTR